MFSRWKVIIMLRKCGDKGIHRANRHVGYGGGSRMPAPFINTIEYDESEERIWAGLLARKAEMDEVLGVPSLEQGQELQVCQSIRHVVHEDDGFHLEP